MEERKEWNEVWNRVSRMWAVSFCVFVILKVKQETSHQTSVCCLQEKNSKMREGIRRCNEIHSFLLTLFRWKRLQSSWRSLTSWRLPLTPFPPPKKKKWLKYCLCYSLSFLPSTDTVIGSCCRYCLTKFKVSKRRRKKGRNIRLMLSLLDCDDCCDADQNLLEPSSSKCFRVLLPTCLSLFQKKINNKAGKDPMTVLCISLEFLFLHFPGFFPRNQNQQTSFSSADAFPASTLCQHTFDVFDRRRGREEWSWNQSHKDRISREGTDTCVSLSTGSQQWKT